MCADWSKAETSLQLDSSPQVEGVKVYTGGEELRRAAAALSGPSLAPKSSLTLPLPTQQASYPVQGLSEVQSA